jgi:hypothetical protein
MKSGPRIGTSVLSSSRADIAPHHLAPRPGKSSGFGRRDQYAPHSPPPAHGQADPVPGGPMIGPGEPRTPCAANRR